MIPGGRWRHRHTVLSIAVLAYFGIRFVEFVLSIAFEDIKTTLGISTFVIGTAVAASTATYALAQLPSGVIGDRFGHHRVVSGSLVLTGAAAVLLAVSPSGVFIVFGMGIVGLVSGAYYSPATALLAEYFDDTGRAIGVHRFGAQVVGLTGPVVGLVGAVHGWRALLLISAAITVPILAGFRVIVNPATEGDPAVTVRDRIAPTTLQNILSRPSVAILTVVAALAQFVDTATFSFLPLLLREYHGLSIEVAGTLFTVYFVAVGVGQPAAGWLSDRLSRDAVTVGTLTVALVGYLLLAFRPPLGIVLVSVVCLGLGMGWGPPVQARIVDQLGEDERGAGFGLVRTCYIGFAALNGLVVGGVVTLSGWVAGTGVLIVPLVVAILVVLAARSLSWLQ
jgi:YNFM family putative membrane transporter